MPIPRRALHAASLIGAVATASCGAATTQSEPPVVQPGAPGEASRPAEAVPAAAARPALHTEADVRFMQGMIAHHAQALEMTALAPQRTERQDVRLLARRIEVAQMDEIDLMRRWLRQRGIEAPVVVRGSHDHSAHHGHHAGQDHHGHGRHHEMMPGMLTAAEMTRLAAATGREFDRLFLEFMIRHHEGALVMVAELFADDGGQEGEIFQFASHVDSDQRIEIARMQRMLTAAR